MKNKKFELLGLVILLVGGYYIYKKIKEVKDLANTSQIASPEATDKKESDIDTIINSSKFGGARSVLQSFDAGYLSLWADAVLNNKSTFTFNKAQYNTQGGTRVKATTPKPKQVAVYNPNTYTVNTITYTN